MEFGLLWYDDDSGRALDDKVGRAAQRYREKFGHWPNTCYVHPHAVAEGAAQDAQEVRASRGPKRQIRVVSASNILLHHYWLGKSTGHPPRKGGLAAN